MTIRRRRPSLADFAPRWAEMEASGFVESFLSGSMEQGQPHPLAAIKCCGGITESGLWHLLTENDFRDISDPGAEEFVRGWLPRRYEEVVKRLSFTMLDGNGRITVNRHLQTDLDTAIRLRDDELDHGLGAFWTQGCHGIEASPWGVGPVSVLLTASVDPAAIDWEGTMIRNMDFLQGDMEEEIHLPDAEVRLLRIDCDEVSWEGEEIASPLRRTKPVLRHSLDLQFA